MFMNSYTELEKLELYAQQIKESGVDITQDQKTEWTELAYACASQGEAGREAFHLISSNYAGYSREECDRHFSYCLKTSKNCVSLGSLVKIAREHGIDLKLPRGRRTKTEAQKQAERQNRMELVKEAMKKQGEWRFNVWRQRPEFKEKGQPWRPFQDRDLDTFYCRLNELGIKARQQDIKSLVCSRDFCVDYDAFNEWLDSLKPWNPDTDPDYLRDFYVGHMEFNDPDYEDFYDLMMKKWHVALVGMMRGRFHENPLMPIFMGRQHIGKTYFARHILPPHLRDYRLEVSPSERIDKDFIISLSETPFIVFDEISFGSTQKNEAFKFIVTSTRSNVRDAYARFRESRERRASLIATTNDDSPIRNGEGSRRYLVVDLKDTVDLENFPLPYEGAYAQALYLLDHGFIPKPDQDESMLITQHNQSYMESEDCAEAIQTFLKVPEGAEASTTMYAGDILRELGYRGFRGKEFTTSKIGKCMKQLGFPSKFSKGRHKYHVVKIDPTVQDAQAREDVIEFSASAPEPF